MFTLNAFINKVVGNNGCMLINSATGVILDLKNKEASILEKILSNNVTDEKLKNYLIEKEWLIEVEQATTQEELSFYKMESHGMTNFSLNKVIIELSGKCRLNCVFCDPCSSKAYASCSCKRWNYDVKKSDYMSIIKQLLSYNVQKIMIIGGDPFFEAYDRLKVLLQELRRQEYYGEIVITTNGSCLDKEKILFLSTYKNLRLDIIFLGCSEEEYRKITGVKQIFKKIVNNVKLIKKYNIKANGTLLLSNMNIFDIGESKVNLLGLNIGIKFIFDQKFNSREILFSPQNRMIQPDYQTEKILNETNCCLYSQIFIASDFKVYPCPYLRKYVLGDASKEEIFSILKKGDYREFWFLNKGKVKGCSCCKYRTICMDCRAIEYAATDELYEEYYCDELPQIL